MPSSRRSADPNIDQNRMMQGPGTRGSNQTANVANGGLQESCHPFKTQIQHGIVIRTGVGMYDATVRVGRHAGLPCVQLSMQNGSTAGWGVSEARLLSEGTPVQVFIPHPTAGYGIILSAGVSIYQGTDATQFKSVFQLDPEPGATEYSERSYKEPHVDTKHVGVIPANSGRAIDLMPGNLAWHNELGVSMGILNLMTFMRANHRAKIETHMMDDLVRIVSGQWQHFTAQGENRIYNDCGYVTGEFSGTHHQCEASGQLEYDVPVMKQGTADEDKGKEASLTLVEPTALPHRRWQIFTGALGSGLQAFMMAPDETIKANTYESENIDQGLAHVGIDTSGRIFAQSAADIVLERWDYIPVPKKLFEAYDPAGQKVTGKGPAQPRLPFKWADKTDPLSHALQLRDYIWWAHRNWDQRLYEFSTEGGGKDWTYPEVGDIEPPADKFDRIFGDKDQYYEYKHKTSQLVLRQDGGITMREAEGAEINLAGGRVIITAPNGVELRSGTSITALAQQDVNIKAHDSVDITATEKDVRIKAERNLDQYSGGGILLEAAGTSIGNGLNNTAEGEDVKGNGISLIARDSDIFQYAASVHSAGKTSIILETLEDDSGFIAVSTDAYMSFATQQLHMAGEDAGFQARNGSAFMFGDRAFVIGGSTAEIFKGDQVPARPWVSTGTNIYAELSPSLGDLFAQFHDQTDWLAPYEPDDRSDMYFTFRTTAQYGLTEDDSRVYESTWAYLSRNGGLDTEAKPWTETEVNETYPWPGKDHYDSSGFYYELSEEKNVESPRHNTPKKRDARTAEGGAFEQKDFHSYIG